MSRHKLSPCDRLDTFHRVRKLLYLVTKNRDRVKIVSENCSCMLRSFSEHDFKNNIIGSNDEYEHEVFRDKLCCKKQIAVYPLLPLYLRSQFVQISKSYSLRVDTVHAMQSIVLIYCNNQVFRLQRFRDYARLISLSSMYRPEVINIQKGSITLC